MCLLELFFCPQSKGKGLSSGAFLRSAVGDYCTASIAESGLHVGVVAVVAVGVLTDLCADGHSLLLCCSDAGQHTQSRYEPCQGISVWGQLLGC